MFKSSIRDSESVHEDALRPAALTAAQALPEYDQAPAAVRDREPAPYPARLSVWRDRAEAWFANVDLAPDLAEDIGSRRWLRGMATLLALGAAAMAFWPDFAPVEAAAALPADPRVRDEYRSQMIMPLALGGDSGRRMGATPLVRPLSGAPERPVLQLATTLGQGDSLQAMLRRAGLGATEIAQVGALVGDAVPPGQIAPGTRFAITLGRRAVPGAPRSLQNLDFRARFDLDVSVTRAADGLALVRRPIAVDTTPLRIRGAIGSSLYRSARNAGAPVAAIQAYLRAIDPHVSLESDIAKGDHFDFVVAYKRSAKGDRQIGELLYAGLERSGKPRLQLLRWNDGTLLDAGGLGRREERAVGAPVAGRITSLFGLRRHPILRYVRMHAGVDFGARYGAPIHAVASGTVAFAGRHGGHGNYVRLDHGGSTGTGYGHMSRIAVSPGMRVAAGQVIGYVGSTGLSTGPHLHFEAYRNGRVVNPLALRFASRPRIDGRELAAFKHKLAALLAITPGAALASIAPEPPRPQQPMREIDRLAVQGAPAAPTPAAPLRHQLAIAGVGSDRD